MSDPILRHKIIDRLILHNLFHDARQRFAAAVRQKNGTGVGVCYLHMADPVKLLVLPGVLVLLDHAVYIVIHRRAGHDACLAPAVHSQLVQIIAGFLICHKSPVLDPCIQKLPGLLVHPLVIGVHIIPKLGLRPVNVQK